MKSLKLSQLRNNINLETRTIIHTIIIKNVAPVEFVICGCIVVNRALYNHKQSATRTLVKHFKDIAKLEYDEIKVIQDIMTS